MTQNIPKTLILKCFDKSSTTSSVVKDKLDQAYKDLFASLFKIKDKDVQRRVLQAINGQNLTCANCAAFADDADVIGRGTLAVKESFVEMQTTASESKIKKPKPKIEIPNSNTSIHQDYSITEKLLLDNLIEESMAPHGFFNFKANEPPSKINDFLFVTTMEHEMRTARICNEEGLYTIHIAAIDGDLYKMRRLMIIYQYHKWDIDIRSEDEKKEDVSSAAAPSSSFLYHKIASIKRATIAELTDADAIGTHIIYFSQLDSINTLIDSLSEINMNENK